MAIKMIVTDIDGTLMNDNNKISDEIFKLIKELHHRNILFVVASGRHVNNLKNIFENVSEQIIFIAQNGAYIEYNNRILFYDIIKKNIIIKILEVSSKLHLYSMLYTKDTVIIKDTSYSFLTKLKKYDIDYKIDEKYNLNDISKVSLMSVGNIDIHKYKEYIEVIPGISSFISGTDIIDITNNMTNKGTALSQLQRLFSINSNETMVFGDSENDIDMFNLATYSYAMYNAEYNVKAKARYVAPSNNNNGVIYTINLMLKHMRD